jgi:hypothetical protein
MCARRACVLIALFVIRSIGSGADPIVVRTDPDPDRRAWI